MDFGELLHVAKQNTENNGVRGYSTKFAPPKKESKDRTLSSGIKRFLAKKEEEEREKERLAREKRLQLEAMRDNKSKNKINKMLKVIKSANKSVVDDAGEKPTGPQQPDEDDYGYVSQESSVFYKQLMEKYKSPEDEKKANGAQRSSSSHTPVKKRPPSTPNTSSSSSTSASSSKSASSSSSSTSKSPQQQSRSAPPGTKVFNPKTQSAAAKPRPRPPPPVANFEELLKLAEQKQFEPIKVDVTDKLKKEERPMSAKEKREHEERMRIAEARKRRLENDNYDYRKAEGPPGPASSSVAASSGKKPPVPPVNGNKQRPIRPVSTAAVPAATSSKSTPATSKPTSGPVNNKPHGAVGKSSQPPPPVTKTRQFPPPDVPQRTRAFPPEDVQRSKTSRPFPPADVRRKERPPMSSHPRDIKRSRYEDEEEDEPPRRYSSRNYEDYDDEDDEDEYDSEMDDFIDDGPLGQADVSSCIKEIFGYDKSRYRDEDFDDRDMESSFAQQMREESYSRKVGRLEDEADMRQEALEKARKAALKRAASRR